MGASREGQKSGDHQGARGSFGDNGLCSPYCLWWWFHGCWCQSLSSSASNICHLFFVNYLSKQIAFYFELSVQLLHLPLFRHALSAALLLPPLLSFLHSEPSVSLRTWTRHTAILKPHSGSVSGSQNWWLAPSFQQKLSRALETW